MNAILFFLIALIGYVVSNTVKNENKAKTPTGALLSTMMYYLGSEQYTYNLVAINYLEPNKWSILQELLPKAAKPERNFESFTAYDTPSRTMYVAAMQKADVATFWKMQISNDATTSTPLISNIDIQYPISSSPEPLNVAPLVLSRIFLTSADQLNAVFSNGEVHEIDLVNKKFTLSHKLLTDEEQLGVIHPTTTYAHAYESKTGLLHSVCAYASDAYYKTTNVATKTEVSSLLLSMPGNQNGKDKFSPQTFTGLHLLQLDGPDAAPSIMVTSESLNNVGFDLLTLINTTTGELGGLVTNLMSYGLVFECQDDINACDLWRISAWDSTNSVLYFQAHAADGDNVGDPMIAVLGIDHTINGKLSWYVNIFGQLPYGLSGFQFAEFK